MPVADHCVSGCCQELKGTAIDTNHRQAAAEQRIGDKRAQGQDGLVLAEDDSGRACAAHDQFEKNRASRAGPATTRDGKNFPGDALTVKRMLMVDDHPRLHGNPSPEAEAKIGMQQGS
jgi:hypothetical protein